MLDLPCHLPATQRNKAMRVDPVRTPLDPDSNTSARDVTAGGGRALQVKVRPYPIEAAVGKLPSVAIPRRVGELALRQYRGPARA